LEIELYNNDKIF